MFSPEVVDRRAWTLAHDSQFAEALRGHPPRVHSLDESWAYRDQLSDAVDPDGTPRRALTDDEQTFLTHELLRCKIDYRYCSDRYAVIAKEGGDTAPIAPRWASQELFLEQLGRLEWEHLQQGHPDGLLVNILKARQLGVSTEIEVILAHRVSTQTSVRGLVAGDIKEQSQYLFSMCELVLASFPWWLRPPVKAHQVGDYWASATETDTVNSTIRTAWGKSSRGGLQEQQKVKGNLGRGRTYSAVHISEFSTWERPEQLQDALMPAIPRRPHVFAAFESTAKGRYDAWHTWWTGKGLGRCLNVFLPWYIEPDKYWLPVPEGWEPKPTTKFHADRVVQTSPMYCLGRTIRLSAEQLYWYESTRAAWETEDSIEVNLHKFLEEYPATPEEAFQYAGRSVFSAATLERLRTYERTPQALLVIEPARDIADLKVAEAAEQARQQAAVRALTGQD